MTINDPAVVADVSADRRGPRGCAAWSTSMSYNAKRYLHEGGPHGVQSAGHTEDVVIQLGSDGVWRVPGQPAGTWATRGAGALVRYLPRLRRPKERRDEAFPEIAPAHSFATERRGRNR